MSEHIVVHPDMLHDFVDSFISSASMTSGCSSKPKISMVSASRIFAGVSTVYGCLHHPLLTGSDDALGGDEHHERIAAHMPTRFRPQPELAERAFEVVALAYG